MKNLFLLIFAGTVSICAQAQFTTPILDNTPPSVNWKQVNSPNFRVLFLEGSDSLALRTINTLETLYRPSLATLQTEPEKISVILQQKNATSNGFVAVGPRRSEFFGMPPQDYNFSGTNNWMDMLAVHEFRHVVQYSKSKRGLNKLVYYLFGEDAYGALSGLAMPPWFWEGDAVGIETALTKSGRGRIPYFSAPFRTNLLERGPYSYDKQKLRSFRDYVPNHYVFGYYMTTHLRRKHDAGIWDRVTDRAFFAPFLPWRLPIALKRETGKRIIPHYWEMIDEVTEIWKEQLDGLVETAAERVNSRINRVWTNYDYPQIDGQGNVVALKSGLGDIQQFVVIDQQGNEKMVFTPGIVNDAGMLSVAGDKLVYVEHEYNPRWRADTYSVIKTVDLNEGKVYRVSKKSRYAAASVSPDQSLIATVLTTVDHRMFLAIIDAETGDEVKRFPNPYNDYYQMPRWSDDGRHIVVLKLRDQQKAIALIDFETGNEDLVAPFSIENFGHPVKYRDHVFYNSAHNGIDNIYAIDLNSGNHYQVTSRKYGGYNPVISADGETIFFNDYTVDGMDVVSMPYNPENWILKDNLTDRNDYYYRPLVEQEQGEDLLLNMETRDYPVSNYRRINGLVNPFAWGFYSSTTADNFMLGVVSQDILGTATISGGYQFDSYWDRRRWFGKVSYQALFPIIDLEVETNLRSESVQAEGRLHTVHFNENVGTIGLRVPLLLTRSRYYEQLNFGTSASFGRYGNFKVGNVKLPSPERTDYRLIKHNVSYMRLLKQSKRDIRSKWGQYLFAQYSHLPIGGDFEGHQFFTQGILFFPGLFKHHSLQLAGRFQYYPDIGSGLPITGFAMRPRGYVGRPPENKEISVLSADYAFPLFYPDYNVGSIVNIQRVRSNLFYDLVVGGEQRYIRDIFSSVGVELSADINVLRFLPLLEVGVRFAYLPESGSYSIMPLIGMFSF
jgi:Tol biopolymer transport system component